MNNTAVREVAKCPNDRTKCGFELERIERYTTDTMEYINARRSSQLDLEQEVSNVKSQIIQCQTEEDRNRLLQSIIKRQKIIKELPNLIANELQIYKKKCRCEKIPDDLLSISQDDIVMNDIEILKCCDDRMIVL